MPPKKAKSTPITGQPTLFQFMKKEPPAPKAESHTPEKEQDTPKRKKPKKAVVSSDDEDADFEPTKRVVQSRFFSGDAKPAESAAETKATAEKMKAFGFSDDEDVGADAKKKTPQRKRSKAVESDVEAEAKHTAESAKKKARALEAPATSAASRVSSRKKAAKEEPAKVAVDPTDFFGSGKIERHTKTTPRKEKAEPVVLVEDSSSDEAPLRSSAKSPAPKSPAKPASARPTPSKTPKAEEKPAKEEKKTAQTPKKVEEKKKAQTPKKEEEKKKVHPPKKEEEAKKTHTPKKEEEPKKSHAPKEDTDEPNAEAEREGAGAPEDDKAAKSKAQFRAFMSRAPPQNLGTREIPEAAPNCFADMVFVVTGELETIARNEVQDIIKRYGGKVASTVPKKCHYAIVGREAGPSKLKKIEDNKIKVLDEDGFYQLLASAPAKGDQFEPKEKLTKGAAKRKTEPEADRSWIPKRQKAANEPQTTQGTTQASTSTAGAPSANKGAAAAGNGAQGSGLWVDRYKPQSLKDLIGNKAGVDKVVAWLRDWEDRFIRGKPAKGGGKPTGARGKDDSNNRAVLISGPPGIGKSTAATLIARECGYEPIEFNASDTRNVSSLREVVAQLLDNRSITEFYSNDGNGKGKGPVPPKKKHLLLMDEVDGMSAGDRGGIAELVKLIKTTKVPIICMANDHSSRKIRTLINYCHDIRFQRPQIGSIKGKMMTIAFKEGLKIQPNALEELIKSAQNDIRQVLNQMSVYRLDSSAQVTYDDVKSTLHSSRKDTFNSMNAFDVVRKMYTSYEWQQYSFDDKMRLFYVDELMPLMMEENYLNVTPALAGHNAKSPHQAVRTLDCLSAAADSFSDADLIDKVKRSQNAWSLMPSHGVAAFVRPAYFMRGGVNGGMINFPQWLGNYSKTGRVDRLLKELQVHMRTHGYSDTNEINGWYLPMFRQMLTRPMIQDGQDGVQPVIDFMDAYTLTREDWDAIMELTQYKGFPEVEKSIDSKVKAAFTRAYNKETHLLPFVEKGALPKRAAAASSDTSFGGEGGDDESGQVKEEETLLEEEKEENEDGVGNDKMIRKAKEKASGKASTKGSAKGKGAATSKASGKGKKK